MLQIYLLQLELLLIMKKLKQIIKIKMKIIKNISIFFFVTLIMTSSKEGLGQKSRDGEEFLIEKKNPLVVPPDFDDLPLPKNTNNEESNNVETEEDIQKLFELNFKQKKKSTVENNSTSLEESIIKKIK